ncbi:FAD-binding domain-containing protein [Roseateles amylovorans]|uniref:Deoxyribodipyrimidine photolyase n=1 Tax=Roseateles amylovorans TaxID=2978473 RepID=A0ABY6B808_9BURK|nr:FAD-binding domain-containing protein [Roseateles amylovorans]UXH80974.1 deoxyribodipyrimidine photolyase [Roseateles amylovorans]
MAAARLRMAAVRPAAYARTRNSLHGAVSGLSPYLTHGFITLADVLADVSARHPLDVQHKFVYELGWRAFFRHVWQHRGDAILQSLHEGPLPDDAYVRTLPDDIRQGRTGVPVIDRAVRELYATGTLHNHARMWLASYVVHLRKVHWRTGADWLYAHLLDGDLASNHLSWQWVAGTGSTKPYLFNAENVARYAPADWHSPGSVIDTSYDALERMARSRSVNAASTSMGLVEVDAAGVVEPDQFNHPHPPLMVGAVAPEASQVDGRDVWLVHPWSLGDVPQGLSPETVVVGLYLSDFHQAWPWSERRWQFVDSRMAALTPVRWWTDATALGEALRGARSVRGRLDLHLARWLMPLAEWLPTPMLFPPVEPPCDTFSQWWRRAVRGVGTAAELLAINEVPSW